MDGSSVSSTRRILFLLTATATLALSGCANMHPTQTGFLNHYEQLQPKLAFVNTGLGLQEIQLARASHDDLAGVDSFYIQPVAWLAPENDWLGKDQTRRERVTKALDDSLRYKFAKIRPLVDQPGPRTATVRAAVTDVASARTITNILASIVVGPISNGGATVEAEVVAPDGRRIAAVDGSNDGGAIDVFGYYIRSGHAKTAARRLATELVDAVEAKNAPLSASVTSADGLPVRRAGVAAISDWWNGPR